MNPATDCYWVGLILKVQVVCLGSRDFGNNAELLLGRRPFFSADDRSYPSWTLMVAW